MLGFLLPTSDLEQTPGGWLRVDRIARALATCQAAAERRFQPPAAATGSIAARPAHAGTHRPKPAFCGGWPALAFVLRRSYQEDSGAWLINQAVGADFALSRAREIAGDCSI